MFGMLLCLHIPPYTPKEHLLIFSFLSYIRCDGKDGQVNGQYQRQYEPAEKDNDQRFEQGGRYHDLAFHLVLVHIGKFIHDLGQLAGGFPDTNHPHE